MISFAKLGFKRDWQKKMDSSKFLRITQQRNADKKEQYFSDFGDENKPASLSSGNTFVSGAGGLRFKSRAGQIGHSVANGSPPLRHIFESSCVARAQ